MTERNQAKKQNTSERAKQKLNRYKSRVKVVKKLTKTRRTFLATMAPFVPLTIQTKFKLPSPTSLRESISPTLSKYSGFDFSHFSMTELSRKSLTDVMSRVNRNTQKKKGYKISLRPYVVILVVRVCLKSFTDVRVSDQV